MSMRSIAVLLAALLGGLVALGGVVAQTSPNFDLGWNVLGGGGGSSRSASFSLGGTASQIAPGTSTSTNFRLDAGFWPGVAPPVPLATPTPAPTATPTGVPAARVYLPLVARAAGTHVARVAWPGIPGRVTGIRLSPSPIPGRFTSP